MSVGGSTLDPLLGFPGVRETHTLAKHEPVPLVNLDINTTLPQQHLAFSQESPINCSVSLGGSTLDPLLGVPDVSQTHTLSKRELGCVLAAPIMVYQERLGTCPSPTWHLGLGPEGLIGPLVQPPELGT